MTSYYMPHLLSREDYKVMSVRFWRIINALPEFKEYRWTKNRKDRVSIVRFRSDKLTVVFRQKNDRRDQYSISVECGNVKDTFIVYDTHVDYDTVVSFCQASHDPCPESSLKSEIIDFIDDYCTSD